MPQKPYVPIDHEKLRKLEYLILPGMLPAGHPSLKRHNDLYAFWKQLWGDFYKSSGSKEVLEADDFMRADAVAGLFDGEQPIGVHLYTFFNLASLASSEHSYWANYSEFDVARLKKQGVEEVMTMEFFAMSPDWRKSVIGLSIAEILAGCGFKLFKASGAEAVVSVARKDVKANEIGAIFGLEVLSANQERHNHPVDLVVGYPDRMRGHHMPEVQHYIERFWQSRRDETGITNRANVHRLKKAA